MAVKVERVKVRHLPNFTAVGQTVVEIWRFIKFFNMAAACHLAFVVRLFQPLAESI